MSYSSLHNHTDYSNASLGFTDSIIKYKELIQKAYDLGLNAIGIENHECLSDHIKVNKYFNELKFERPFKVILGNEIYLISEEEDSYMRGTNEETEIVDEEEGQESFNDNYYHFVLNALDNIGHKQIRILSDRAWRRAYVYNGLMRRPTYYTDLEEIIGTNKGHVVGSTACLGGFIPKLIIDWKMNNNENACKTLQEVISYLDDLFGHGNFFLEMQPCKSNNKEQILVNLTLKEIGEYLDIKTIVTTDAHYLTKEKAFEHKVLLNAKDGGDARETEDFYATTYIMSDSELRDYMRLSFDDEYIDYMFANTNSISDRVVGYSFEHTPMIPQIPIEKIPNFQITHRYKQYYDKYEEFNYYANIENFQDKYFFYKIETALYELIECKGKDIEPYIDRLNKEFHELRLISEAFNDSMASYYTTMSEIVNLIWETDSLSMPARGSGAGFEVCYLFGITQIDPLPLGDYYPFWRHLSAERGVEIAD